MAVTTRSRVVELSSHSPVQIAAFYLLAIGAALTLYLFVAAPLLDTFFETFLRSEVVSDGSEVSFTISENRAVEVVTTGTFSTWALVDPRSIDASRPQRSIVDGKEVTTPRRYTAEYIFKPMIALAPLVLVGGFLVAALLSAVLPGMFGYLGQKIEREILVALDRLAMSQYGEHTSEEIKALVRTIVRADVRELHDLAAQYGMPFADLDLMQRALMWSESKGVNRLMKTHDAIKFYMREYFTDRYSNAVLGLVYMGAAILIIVIGIRGLKFLPATDPSVVLSALGLEFILLITYAAILMYGRTDESTAPSISSSGQSLERSTLDVDTESLLRAFLAVPRTRNDRSEDHGRHSS